MLIGKDFDKIEFDLFGFEFVEPNAFIGDLLIAIVAFYFAFRVQNMSDNQAFYRQWRLFFLFFGITFFVGGFSHLCYKYWDVEGKFLSWYLGILSPFFIEQAMISIHPDGKKRTLFSQLSKIKLFLAFAAESLIILFVDLHAVPEKGLIVVTANTTIGLLFSLGYLGARYSKMIHPNMRYFWMSTLVMLPTIAFQAFKINFAQWFDRNDVSHLLLIVGLFYYIAGIRAFHSIKSMRTING